MDSRVQLDSLGVKYRTDLSSSFEMIDFLFGFFKFENLGTFFQNRLVFKAVNKLGNSVFIQEDYSKVESQSPAVVIGGSPWSICLS